MTRDITWDDLLALPKAELHVHLDGSLRPETLLDLARDQGVRLPARSPELLARALLAESSPDLEAYLEKFEVPISLLQNPAALERAAYELALDAAAENVRYLEVRYSPALHTREGMTHQEAVDAVLEGLARAEGEARILTGLILCGIRNMDARVSLELAKVAVANRTEGVVGFDLAGAEAGHPASDHQEAFQYAEDHDLAVTVHAGEGDGPGSIRQALHRCHARRLGHGTRLHEDPGLEDYVRDFRVPLEVCLTSNAQTHVAPSVAEHPFRRYFDGGLVVTLSTDSRLISGTSLTREYWLAHQELGFNLAELAQVSLMAFHSAFLPLPAKLNLLEEVEAEMGGLGIR